MNGYHVFGNVVWIGDLKEATKYALIDDKWNKLDFELENCLEKC